MKRRLHELARPRLGTLAGLPAYVALLAVGGFGIAEFAGESARSVLHIADLASDRENDRVRAAAETPRVAGSIDRFWARTKPAKVGTEPFVHERMAPVLLERYPADDLAELKRAISERVVEDDATPWHTGRRRTFKTMCVRLCDGAYFPISFATTRDHFARDAKVCASRCGSPTRLFVYQNPGATPEAMRDRSGRSYLALPTAFQFRRGAVAGCSCQAKPWEEAARERHRYYALEEMHGEGKSVDMAQLKDLRKRFGALAKVGPRQPPAGKLTTASLPLDKADSAGQQPAVADREDAGSATARLPAGGDQTTGFDGIRTASLNAGRFQAATARDVGDDAVAKPGGSDQVQQAGHDTETATPGAAPYPPLPGRSRLAPGQIRDLKNQDPKSKVGSYKKRKRLSARKLRSQRSKAANATTAAAAEVLPAIVERVAGGISEQQIWGVGRNAHGRPRGNTAGDAFARNFY